MPTTAKELREKRGKSVADSRKILDAADAEKRELTKEEDERFEAFHVEQEKLKAQIDKIERQEKLEAEQRASIGDPKIGKEDASGKEEAAGNGDGAAAAVTEEHRALALQAWLRSGKGKELTKEQDAACKLVNLNPRVREFDMALGGDYRKVRAALYDSAMEYRRRAGLESRAQSININTAGGYLIPEGFVYNLEQALLAFANMRSVATVFRTDSGNDLPWPTNNDTGNKGAIIAENTVVTEQAMTFGQIVFHAYKYTSFEILISAELMQDSAFNLAQYAGEALGVRLARIQADHFTTGTGAGQPTGIVTAATLGKTGASSTAIAADEIFDLKHSVDIAYRPGAGFMFHDNIFLALKKLKDGLGRYLWKDSLAGGTPDTLDGDPITINQSMASSIATTNKTMLYGQLKKYMIRDVAGLRLVRLDERYADLDQVAFLAFMRCDGNLLDAGTHPVKYYAQL